MANKEIKTSIEISASPESIWKILTDFEDYENWNPFITKISGEQRKGGKLKALIGGMKFKPLVLKYDDNKELRWLGTLFLKGLFDGEHSFQIIDNMNGTCTFLQEEKFNGILVGLFAKKLETDTKSGFEQMNLKLKELAEQK
ncbi:SRPBCC domain-containing protein [Robiginitalea aurantiaca]|uniref:SRPBCC domain-containing protein n=1 Tax=Robiginitalea aurantiaca TaxID=3056915 RepID=A0ABT7WFL0_9FLAO|nr:SRPBCC domain-containing protein [Robiginitalea aurantiaca]MDM9631701.1 SRPBCC domain-containing protein [Robiginitalea aurantiaca]